MRKLYQFIFILVISIANMQAQNEDTSFLYRFVNQDQSDGTTYVFHHNIETNAAELKPISNTEFNSEEGYLESFILQPLEGRVGIVLIASAKKPDYFLKRSGNPTFAPANVNEPVRFEKLTSEDDIRLFCWEIVMQDEDDADIISIEVGNFRQFGLQTRIDGTNPTVTLFRNETGQRPGRTVANETVANRFRFKMERIANVF